MYEIYSAGLEKLGEVEAVVSDNHSLHWQQSGTMVLIAAATENNLRRLKNDCFLLVRDDQRHGGRLDGLYVICNVTHDEDRHEVTVNGRSALFLLHQRAAMDTVLTDTTAGAALAGQINENARALPVQASAEREGDPEVIRYPLSGGALDELSASLMSYCGIGHTAELSGGTVRLHFSAGRDISARDDAAILGSHSGRARSASIGIDASDFFNVAVGTLVFQNKSEEAFAFGETEAAGSARRELYVGALRQSSGEAEADFRARAEKEAGDKLLSHLLRTTISADISPADYGHPYRVGDIIRVQVGAVTLRKRIISAAWLRDQNQDKVTLTLGEQLNTIVAEIREQEKQTAAKAGGAAKAAEENAEKIAGILTDHKALIAQVTDLVAGMDAYVINKVFEDYKYSVARLFAAMQEKDDQMMAELAVKVSTDDLKEELNIRLADYLTANAAAELYVTGSGVTAAIGAYIVTDQSGNTSTLAAMLADIIKLQGDVTIIGDLSIEDGRLRVGKGILVYGNSNNWGDLMVSGKFFINSGNLYVGGVPYVPKQITYVTKTGYASSKLLTLDKDRYEENFDPQGADQVIRRLKTMSNPVRKPKNPTAVLSVRYTAPENIPAGTTISVPTPANLYDCTTWENYYEKPEYDYVGYYKSTSNPETATDTVLAQSGGADDQAAETNAEVTL